MDYYINFQSFFLFESSHIIFKIAEIETNDTLFTVQINNFREETRYIFYGKMNDTNKFLYSTDPVKLLIGGLILIDHRT